VSRGLGNRLGRLETSRDPRQEVSDARRRDIEEQLQSCDDPEIHAKYAEATEAMRTARNEEEEGNACDAYLDSLEELRLYLKERGSVATNN
jgi:hypothetical protein